MKTIHLAIGALTILTAGLFAQQVAKQFAKENTWTAWRNHNTPCFPTAVACSADGRTVYLVVSTDNPDGKLLVSNDGGATWRLIQP
jgi:hypothetical protein